MFATVRETHYESDQQRPPSAELQQFRALRERQPGYAGMVAVDAGSGRTIALVLWETEAHATAATAVLDAEVQRVVGTWGLPVGQIIAQGPVLRTDLIKS